VAGHAADVFISYKAEDRARVTPLVEALEAEGFTVWWDAHIGGGINWQEEIEQHLNSAKCVVVAWSKRSVGHSGHFVRDEARRAQRRDAYLPVCLDRVEPPLGFGEIQALSLKGWKGDRSDPRFQAAIDAVRKRIAGEGISHAYPSMDEPRISRRAVVIGGASVAAVAAAGGWIFLKPAPANSKRIAVMPFADLSPAHDQAYFSEGIAEELRGAFSRIGLEVIGRASSDAVKDLDIRAAASRLGVANILTGSVRRSPQMVRISAQLVRGSNGVERWAQTYDRAPGDEIKIQSDIATTVAQVLSITMGPSGAAVFTLGGTTDSTAQDLFLRARVIYLMSNDPDANEQSIALLDAAIARDPNYARAYALKSRNFQSLATSYTKSRARDPADMADNLSQAEAAAKRAIALEPKLGLGYVELGATEAIGFNFRSALPNVRKALALSPNELSVVSMASVFMEFFGAPHKALELDDRAIQLDPLQSINYTRRAETLFTLRDYRRSISASRKALELAPQRYDAHREIANCLALMNRPAEAKIEYMRLPSDDPLRLAGEAILSARTRDLAGADRIVAQMHKLFGDQMNYRYAQIHAQASDLNQAFIELDNSVRAKDPILQSLRSDPFLDPIRGDRRYIALLKRLNFPTWT
jgi:serine/threonine-protein kinase